MALHFKRTTTIPTDLLLQLRYDEEHGPEFTEIRSTHLPAEWYPQCAVQLTWPHADTDWAPVLKDVTRCYIQMAMQIAYHHHLFLKLMDVESLWQLLYDHGASGRKKEGTERFWKTLTPQQQKQVFTTISTKLQEDKFVQYDPIRASRENIIRRKRLVLSYDDYYMRYGTTEEVDGWQKRYLQEEQRTIYVQQ